jgi:hypothetical protein
MKTVTAIFEITCDVNLIGVCDNDADVKKVIRSYIEDSYAQRKKSIGYFPYYDFKFNIRTKRFQKSIEPKTYDICSAMSDTVKDIHSLIFRTVTVNEKCNINILTY